MAVARRGETQAHPVDSARSLAALARELAPATERERRLPAELVDALAAAGIFSLLIPRSLGGGEVEPQVLVDCVHELARGDAAAAWCVSVATTSGVLAAYLPEDQARAVYSHPARCWGGVFAPKGRAVLHGEQLRVSGRWPFTSGIDHCDWLMGGCVVEEDGETRKRPSGRPDVRLVLFPAAAVERIDTWDTAGLRGTGSHDMVVEDLLVPAARSASVLADAPREPGTLYAFPMFGLLALAIAAVGLGCARGAIDDLRELAGGKVPAMGSRTLAARPDTQARVARAEARLRAARALVAETVGQAWQRTEVAGTVSIEDRAALRVAATHAMGESAAVVDEMYALAGGSAIYGSSSLGRRFRDIHVATQHMLVGPSTWELAGRVMLGVPADTEQL